ncbi:uncharacterized protein LOC132703211 [Cylas formicarius]|uniref:uncharacterized protein LOC132703211 n=1 Tax=Cylas formicarius TaxID=197179 RepID=UPI0029584292|nr:uncharacterized protein LOC132703211 [Cylas formicarius]
MLSVCFIVASTCFASEAVDARKDVEDKLIFLRKFLEHLSAKTVNYFCDDRENGVTVQKALSADQFQTRFLTKTQMFDVASFKKDRIAIITDSRCKQWADVLKTGKRKKLYHRMYTWMVFGNRTAIEALGIAFPFDSNVYVAEVDRFEVNVYRLVKNTLFSQRHTQQHVARWSVPYKKFMYLDTKRPRMNLMGEPLRVSYSLAYNSTLHHLMDYRQVEDFIPRMNYRLMNHITFYVNAKHQPIFRSGWGFLKEKTGVYSTGMFGDLQQGRADIAGNNAFVTHPRIDHFTFLPAGATTDDFLYWMFRAPPLSYTDNIWILPFQKLAWYCLCSLLVLFLAVLTLLSRADDALFGNHITFSDVATIVIAALTQRGNARNMKSVSGHIASYTLFALCLFVYVAYSAQFFVLLQASSNKITDIWALVNSGMELGAEDVLYNRDYYTRKNDLMIESVRSNFYDDKIKGRESKFFVDKSVGMKKVQRESYAFQILRSTGYQIIDETFNEIERRSIRIIDTFLSNNGIYLSIPKNSPYFDLFSISLLKLAENGMWRREHVRLYPPKPIPDYSRSVFVSIGLEDISFVFLCLIVGMVASLAIFLLENIVHYHRALWRRIF